MSARSQLPGEMYVWTMSFQESFMIIKIGRLLMALDNLFNSGGLDITGTKEELNTGVERKTVKEVSLWNIFI